MGFISGLFGSQSTVGIFTNRKQPSISLTTWGRALSCIKITLSSTSRENGMMCSSTIFFYVEMCIHSLSKQISLQKMGSSDRYCRQQISLLPLARFVDVNHQSGDLFSFCLNMILLPVVSGAIYVFSCKTQSSYFMFPGKQWYNIWSSPFY